MAQKFNYTILISAIFLLGFSSCGENEVTAPPLTQDNPAAATINSGETHTFTLAPAIGGQGSITHQWQSSVDNVAWADISGATSPNFTTSVLTTNTYFRRQATANRETITSASALITVIPDPKTTDIGVTIGGITWATRNVASFNTFASGAETFGGYYTWEQALNACPPGWRLPTREEFNQLNNAGSVWTTKSDVYGRLFGTAPNQIFLPAAGRRHTSGSIGAIGAWGHYWSSTPSGTPNSMHLWITSSGSSVSFGDRATGRSVRCVAE